MTTLIWTLIAACIGAVIACIPSIVRAATTSPATALAVVAVAGGIGAGASRIVGGTDASPLDFPSFVSVQYLGSHNCGGTLITPDHVLTAGHCLAGKETYSISVRSPLCGFAGSSKLIIHPGYDQPAGSYNNDIAVIELASPLSCKLANLADRAPAAGADGIAVGMGWTAWGGPTSPALKQAPQIIMDRAAGAAVAKIPAEPTRLYATWPSATICKGDSGGPLYMDGQVVGVSAAVISGCPVNSTEIFTSVAVYTDWVAEVTGESTPYSGWWCPSSGCDGSGYVLSSNGVGKLYVGMFSYTATGDDTWMVANVDRLYKGRYEGTAFRCQRIPGYPVTCQPDGRAIVATSGRRVAVSFPGMAMTAIAPFRSF